MARPRKRMNARTKKENAPSNPCVYRYIDMRDNTIKYVGIVRKAALEKRIMQHSIVDFGNDVRW